MKTILIWFSFFTKGNYRKLVVKDRKPLIIRSAINELEKQLPVALFIRVHKSCIVSRAAIEKTGSTSIHIGETVIRIGTTYKQEVMKRIRETGTNARPEG